MDIVLSKLENTNITPNEASSSKTNFDSLYKNWGRLGNQEERRREILEVQKNNRYTKLDKYRGILNLVDAVEEHETEVFGDYQRVIYRPSIYVAGFNKAPSYSEVLMLSEWMIEKPSDFETQWVVVPCPKGSRVLVVAANGITRLFTKYGNLMYQCRTGLPGGNPYDTKLTKCCVLDGFYQKKTKTLYLLDLLAWNSQPMTDGEFEFRDYWMRCKLSELRDLTSTSKRNNLNFNLLPKVSCNRESFQRFMMKTHFEDVNELDGLLFFHQRAHYFAGETPLVGWLFPYMVPEVLGNDITVNPAYMIQKPKDYTTQAAYITEFNAKMITKQRDPTSRKKKTKSNEMDTTEVDQNESNTSTDKNETKMAADTTESISSEAKDQSVMDAESTADAGETDKPKE